MPRFLLTAAALLLSSPALAGKLSIQWVFANVEEGYDHDNRMDVWVDGQKLAESSVTPQTTTNSLKMEIPAGATSIRLVNMAFYQGEWEEHTFENDYSQDCVWEWSSGSARRAPKKVKLIFDLDEGVRAKVR